ncbi:MAG: DUF3500 domain-containing protein [Planctomycetota bacterium]|jgi:hypothetical protein
MQRSFALSLLLAGAAICGVAMWSSNARSEVRAQAQQARPVVVEVVPHGEEVLARALLLLLSQTQRNAAVLGERPEPAFLLQRAVSPTVIVAGRGVRHADLPPAAQVVLLRLVEQCAGRCRGADVGTALTTAARGRSELSFAFAGGDALGGPCYVRLHGEGFVAEWLRTPAGREHTVWRDFVADAKEPWLGARVASELGGR